MNSKNFLFIAHRGESYIAPENTHAAIDLAWQRDADAVEVDIRLTKDERIVVIHDNSTLRTGRVLKRISSSDYEDLAQIKIGIFKGKEWEGERIPLLADVIDNIPENKTLFVEIKSDYKTIEPLRKLIYQKDLTSDQIKFIGFDIKTMKSIKKSLPEFESYWIIEGKHYKSNSLLTNSIEKCKAAGLNGLDVQEKKYLNYEIIQSIKKAGLNIYTWTVDNPVRAKQLVKDGIEGITTNRAHWLKTKITEQ